jgi:hypothetical protein
MKLTTSARVFIPYEITQVLIAASDDTESEKLAVTVSKCKVTVFEANGTAEP